MTTGSALAIVLRSAPARGKTPSVSLPKPATLHALSTKSLYVNFTVTFTVTLDGSSESSTGA